MVVYLAVVLFKHPRGWGGDLDMGPSFLQAAIGKEQHTSAVGSAA